jgi:hypothetical protein
MLKALPVKHAAHLYMVGKEPTCCNYGGLQGDEWRIFSNDLYLYFRDHTKGFESLTAFQSFTTPLLTRRVGDSQPPVTVNGRFAAGNEFSTLGVPLALGRPIQPSDDTEGAPPVAVISYRMWQRRLGLDPHILGTNFTMNGVIVAVVGVTAPEYQGEIVQSDPPELWLALNQEAKFTGADAAHTHHPDTHWLDVVGRIAPDASLEQITAQLNVELRQWLRSRDTLTAAARAQIGQQKTQLSSAKAGVNDVAENYGRALNLLMAAAGFVLLSVCESVAARAGLRSACGIVHCSSMRCDTCMDLHQDRSGLGHPRHCADHEGLELRDAACAGHYPGRALGGPALRCRTAAAQPE